LNQIQQCTARLPKFDGSIINLVSHDFQSSTAKRFVALKALHSFAISLARIKLKMPAAKLEANSPGQKSSLLMSNNINKGDGWIAVELLIFYSKAFIIGR